MLRALGIRCVVLVVVIGSACPRAAIGEGAGPRSAVIVTIEALRPDRLQELPAFRRLGADAVVFEDAVSVSPMARVASATILTGLAPDRHGVRDDLSDRLSDSTPTLATAAREAKARTAAFVSTPLCSFASGFDRGFDLFDGPEETAVGPGAFEPPQRAAAEVVDHAEKWIAAVPAGTPFFGLDPPGHALRARGGPGRGQGQDGLRGRAGRSGRRAGEGPGLPRQARRGRGPRGGRHARSAPGRGGRGAARPSG